MKESPYERARRQSTERPHHDRMYSLLDDLANTVQLGVTDVAADVINKHINAAYANTHTSKHLHDHGMHADAAVYLDQAANHVDTAHKLLAQSGSDVQGSPSMESSQIAHNYSLMRR
jgi:hypothetical protein